MVGSPRTSDPPCPLNRIPLQEARFNASRRDGAEIAQRFQRWVTVVDRVPSPSGTTAAVSVVPLGLIYDVGVLTPALEMLGYSQRVPPGRRDVSASLRDARWRLVVAPEDMATRTRTWRRRKL
jgi:hypothetical protein